MTLTTRHQPVLAPDRGSFPPELEPEVVHADVLEHLRSADGSASFDLTFLDPPFNQGRDYDRHDDSLSDRKYWDWMHEVCARVRARSSEGAAIYFMQREKHVGRVTSALEDTGWTLQSVIVWRKKATAVPQNRRFSKQWQVIVFATNGAAPRLFNNLRVYPPMPPGYRIPRPRGVRVTDIWDDIRELTSGYFAGAEPLRDGNGERIHLQQAPLALLLRILLASTEPGDLVLDPFAGTGTSLVASRLLGRRSVGVDNSERNVAAIRERLSLWRGEDDLERWRDYYWPTPGIERVWPSLGDVSRSVSQSVSSGAAS